MTGLASEKMGVREGARAILVNAPKEAVEAINPLKLELATKLAGHLITSTFLQKARKSSMTCSPNSRHILSQQGCSMFPGRKIGSWGPTSP